MKVKLMCQSFLRRRVHYANMCRHKARNKNCEAFVLAKSSMKLFINLHDSNESERLNETLLMVRRTSVLLRHEMTFRIFSFVINVGI